jgi:hypothetical protein
MAGAITGMHTFAADVGPEPLSLLDTNYGLLLAGINSLNTFDNWYVDSGVADAAVVTILSQQTVALQAGLTVTVQMAATNLTATPTLNVNGTGAAIIRDAYGGNVLPGQLVAASIRTFVYSGTAWVCTTITNFSPNSLLSVHASKPAVTARSSVIVLANDPDLAVTIPLAGRWAWQLCIQCYGTSTGTQGINGGMNYSAAFVANASFLSNGLFVPPGDFTVPSTADQVGASVATSAGVQSNAQIQTLATAPDGITLFGTLDVTTSGGVFAFAWAQKTTSANATNVAAGGFLIAQLML